MRCWIAVYLPLLPLHSLRPRWCEPLPMAITEQGQVVAMSRLAAAQGVRHGMRASGVQAIAPAVLLQERDRQRERDALDALALALLQYTPELAASDEATLLMDVTASLSVFRGRRALCARVRDSVHALGFSLRLGMAPTGQGAWLLAHRRLPAMRLAAGAANAPNAVNDVDALKGASARTGAGARRRVVSMDSLQRELDRTHFRWLPAAQAHADWLEGIGCVTLGDLRRLPRAGLQRRTDPRLLAQLDRAYGEAPELFDWLQAPACFMATMELPYRVEQAAALLSAAHRLLAQMAGWLVARQQSVARLRFLLLHERGRTKPAPTTLEIALAEPAWQEAHLMRLAKERFARLQLPAPVVGLQLHADELAAWTPPTAQLFPEPGGTPEDYRRLLELLVARLGQEAVQLASPQADHRPEAANRWQGAHDAGPAGHRAMNDADDAQSPTAARPFWLLEQPLPLIVRGHRPFYGSPLRLLSGPERIESGWWDGALALRDYFIAQGDEGACYWIYRERDAGSARWFLHGLFA